MLARACARDAASVSIVKKRINYKRVRVLVRLHVCADRLRENPRGSSFPSPLRHFPPERGKTAIIAFVDCTSTCRGTYIFFFPPHGHRAALESLVYARLDVDVRSCVLMKSKRHAHDARSRSRLHDRYSVE